MKKLHIALLSITVLLLASCKQEKEKPKVIYDATNRESKVDSTQVAISDLPIQMEGTDYLIHPVGDLRFMKEERKQDMALRV
jgi:hypothetical protein